MRELFRAVLPEEVPAVFTLFEQRVRWMDENGLDSWNRSGYLEHFNENYFREHCAAGRFFALAADGSFHAAAVLMTEDSRWEGLPAANALYVHNLAGNPAVKGAGSRMLAAAEREALARGMDVLRLDCDRRIPALLDWYAARGYRTRGECTEGDSYHGLCLEKRLRGAGAVTVRDARPGDAEAFARIYAPYVEKTAITFELVPPDAAEFRRRMEAVQSRYPWLAAEEEQEDGSRRITGYAYAGAFKGRAAYDWSCELSVYVEESARGKGLGRRLYAALEEDLRRMGLTWMYACIASPPAEDETLTRASILFHERLGFELCGTFPDCASKFGRWYDMVWMKRQLAPCLPDPAPIRSWRECE